MTYVDAFFNDILRYAAGFFICGNIAERAADHGSQPAEGSVDEQL